MHVFRFKLARFIGHLPNFPGQYRLTRLLVDPDQLGNYRDAEAVITTDQFGLRYRCKIDSFIEWGMIFHGGFEKGLVKFLVEVANTSSVDIFLDIGANTGTVGIPVATEVKQTYFFEPIPANLGNLQRNLNLNHTRLKDCQIELHQIALSSGHGTNKISFDPMNCNQGTASLEPNRLAGDSITTIDVVTRPLDALQISQNKQLLIKIDIEGHEMQMLKGAERTLADNKCFVYVETIDDRVAGFMNGLGYRTKFLSNRLNSRLRPSADLEGHLLATNFDEKIPIFEAL